MPVIEEPLTITTRIGSLSLVRVVLEGPDGMLHEGVRMAADAFESRSRYLVYIPRPACQEGYLERLKRIERLTYHGWMIPDSIVRDPKVGLAALYRIEQGTPLCEATDGQLGSLGDRALLMASLCRVVAHGHDAEIFHGNISDELIICNGGYPMLIDAPVGGREQADSGGPRYGRAATDIRAVASLLGKLTLENSASSRRIAQAGLLEEIAEIVTTARADEPRTRFVQITQLGDRLSSLHRMPKRKSPVVSGPLGLAVAAALFCMIAGVGYWLGNGKHSVTLVSLHAQLAAAERQLQTEQQEVLRLGQKINSLPQTSTRVFQTLRHSDKLGVIPDNILAFTAIEQLLWPIGYEYSQLPARISFHRARMQTAREFVMQHEAQNNGDHLEVLTTRLLLSTWEFEAGETQAAADTLRRLIPALERACTPSDPLLIGAGQLLVYVSGLAAGQIPDTPADYEPWVKRAIDIALSTPSGPGPYGELIQSLDARMNDEVNLERDMEFQRSVIEKRGIKLPLRSGL